MKKKDRNGIWWWMFTIICIAITWTVMGICIVNGYRLGVAANSVLCAAILVYIVRELRKPQ